MLEKKSTEVQMYDIDALAVQLLVEFAYTSQVVISENNVQVCLGMACNVPVCLGMACNVPVCLGMACNVQICLGMACNVPVCLGMAV